MSISCSALVVATGPSAERESARRAIVTSSLGSLAEPSGVVVDVSFSAGGTASEESTSAESVTGASADVTVLEAESERAGDVTGAGSGTAGSVGEVLT
jgi:hypothetical protein